MGGLGKGDFWCLVLRLILKEEKKNRQKQRKQRLDKFEHSNKWKKEMKVVTNAC